MRATRACASLPCNRRSHGSLAIASVVALVAAWSIASFTFVTGIIKRQPLARNSRFAAESEATTEALEDTTEAPGMCFGHCLQPDGTWQLDKEGVPIQSAEEEAMATEVWELFRKQFASASERGMYMDTPVAERDIKYRWRKMRDNFGLTSQQVLEVMEQDAMPLVVDAEFVKKTWDAMVKGSSKVEATEVLLKHPGILVSGPGIENNMAQAKLTSTVIGGMRSIGRMFR